MPNRKPQKRNASATVIVPGMTYEEFLEARGVKDLGEIDATRERLPSSVVDLTAEEKRGLKDPDWIDEDDAAAIMSDREEEPEHLARPFEEILREHGLDD